jgi:hypothetical protein
MWTRRAPRARVRGACSRLLPRVRCRWGVERYRRMRRGRSGAPRKRPRGSPPRARRASSARVVPGAGPRLLRPRLAGSPRARSQPRQTAAGSASALLLRDTACAATMLDVRHPSAYSIELPSRARRPSTARLGQVSEQASRIGHVGSADGGSPMPAIVVLPPPCWSLARRSPSPVRLACAPSLCRDESLTCLRSPGRPLKGSGGSAGGVRARRSRVRGALRLSVVWKAIMAARDQFGVK